MTICLKSPRTFKVIALCVENVCYCYSLKTIEIVTLVHLEGSQINLFRKDPTPLSSNYCS